MFDIEDKYYNADIKAFRQRYHGRGYNCCTDDRCMANLAVAKRYGFRPDMGRKPKATK